MEIDDDGPAGTAGEHWKSRTAKDDLMSGYTYSLLFLTPMTLAFMEDTTHFFPDYSMSQRMAFGYKKGCGFVRDKCINNGETNYPDTFSTDSLRTQCTTEYSAIGMGEVRLSRCPDSVYDYFGSNRCTSSNRMDYCPLYDEQTKCATPVTDWTQRCFNMVDGTGASCMSISCDFDRQVYTVEGVTCTPGGVVNSHECPDFAIVCPYKIQTISNTPCPIDGCSLCVNGKCVRCQGSYILSFEDGKTCTTSPAGCGANCVTCVNGKCTACNNDLIPSADGLSCVAKPASCGSNCVTCVNGKCTACSNDLIPSADGSSCVAKPASCGSNCVTCVNEKCEACGAEYMVSAQRDACVLKIDRCTSADNDGKCTSCSESYHPSDDGTKCVKKGTPWWVWLIVGIVVAAVLASIIVTILCCTSCCAAAPGDKSDSDTGTSTDDCDDSSSSSSSSDECQSESFSGSTTDDSFEKTESDSTTES
ncbi:hypothetical protein AGDE_16584 [Angomonas deanei]|nr:hypothetical protein AGDE_16584 [Angomonas deanei]|eukprot:EPY16825.1 hypothetical protein AGDE_16584 [Angomonas deanei]